MTYGFDGMPDLAGGPECLILWGNSPDPPARRGAEAHRGECARAAAAKRRRHLAATPSRTDLALALGMLGVIVAEGLYDHDFVARWTVGFEELQRHLSDYPPDKVEKITCGAGGEDRSGGEDLRRSSPGCLWNGNASDDTYNSTQCARAFAILQSICGNLDVPGGTCHFQGTIVTRGPTGTYCEANCPQSKTPANWVPSGATSSPRAMGFHRAQTGRGAPAAHRRCHPHAEALSGEGTRHLRHQPYAHLEQRETGEEKLWRRSISWWWPTWS